MRIYHRFPPLNNASNPTYVLLLMQDNMTYSRATTTVVFTLAALGVVRAFVPPAHVSKTCAAGSVSSNPQRDTPKAREGRAVGPLSALSLGDLASSIGEIFERESQSMSFRLGACRISTLCPCSIRQFHGGSSDLTT